MSWQNQYREEKNYLGIEWEDDSPEAKERIRKEIYPGKPPPWINDEGFIPGAIKDGIKYFIFGPWFLVWRWPYYLLEAWNRSPDGNGGCKSIGSHGETVGYFRWPSNERSWLWLCAVLAIGIFFVYSMGDPEFRVWFWRVPLWHVRLCLWLVGMVPGDFPGSMFEFNPASYEWTLQ